MKLINGHTTSAFGTRIHPVTKQTSFHNGIDIAAPIGTPIYSPCNGICIGNYTHATGGNTIILYDRDRNMRFGFCHLDTKYPAVGESVYKGDIIAKSGNTGRSTGPHLHFSAQINGRFANNAYTGGTFVDPTPFTNID